MFLSTMIVLQIITTPTKAYQLCSRLVPKSSPEVGSFGFLCTESSSRLDNDILNEPVPPEMSEQALEAVSEELRTVQVMLTF
jgi:kinesin family protein 15